MKSINNDISIFLIVSFFMISCNHAAEMVYEFGVDEGQTIYTIEGGIPFLRHSTTIPIPVSADVKVTYVKVTVNSLSPPKVDYESALNQVLIKYTWIQPTLSKYTILAKGVSIK